MTPHHPTQSAHPKLSREDIQEIRERARLHAGCLVIGHVPARRLIGTDIPRLLDALEEAEKRAKALDRALAEGQASAAILRDHMLSLADGNTFDADYYRAQAHHAAEALAAIEAARRSYKP